MRLQHDVQVVWMVLGGDSNPDTYPLKLMSTSHTCWLLVVVHSRHSRGVRHAPHHHRDHQSCCINQSCSTKGRTHAPRMAQWQDIQRSHTVPIEPHVWEDVGSVWGEQVSHTYVVGRRRLEEANECAVWCEPYQHSPNSEMSCIRCLSALDPDEVH